MTTGTGRCAGLKIMALGLVLMLAGCDDSKVVIKDEIKSPDGSRIARVQTHAYSGPGNNAMFAEVDLFWTENPQPIQVILLNAPHDKYAGLKVTWHGNNALEVIRHPEAKVVFQAVKAIDVDISLR